VPFLKFVLILVVAVTSTLAVYHFAVRPAPALRAMLGMRPQRLEGAEALSPRTA
jgi:hypothetical protein